MENWGREKDPWHLLGILFGKIKSEFEHCLRVDALFAEVDAMPLRHTGIWFGYTEHPHG